MPQCPNASNGPDEGKRNVPTASPSRCAWSPRLRLAAVDSSTKAAFCCVIWSSSLMAVLTKTLRLRIKDKHASVLRQMACEVNQVWNHINATSAKAARPFDGDVASAKLVKTKMAKSTLDAGWSMFKTMLEYKSHQAGIVFEVVSENYTTQTCSCCGTIPASSPKGRAGLRIREWVCSTCATVHDRDVNAAKNILAAGHRRLAAGIPVL